MMECKPPCRHCGRPCTGNRPKQLCWTCYYAEDAQGMVRDRYLSTSKFGHRGVGNVHIVAPPLPQPTAAAPGTPEKVAVLEFRAANGYAMHHPLDGKVSERATCCAGTLPA